MDRVITDAIGVGIGVAPATPRIAVVEDAEGAGNSDCVPRRLIKR